MKSETLCLKRFDVSRKCNLFSPFFSISSCRTFDDAYLYGRFSNDSMEQIRLKMLEFYKVENNDTFGSFDCIICSSGMQSLALLFFVLASRKVDEVDEVVIADDFYYEIFSYCAGLKGWKVKKINIDDDTALKNSITPFTKMVFVESCSLPFSNKHDVRKICSTVHGMNMGVLVVVDNTVLTPYYYNPFVDGADVVVDSLTKYLNGHGDAVGGSVVLPSDIVDLSCFNNYQVLGSRIDPMSAYFINRGLSTFVIRMDKITSSAKIIYSFLISIGISLVCYAGCGGVVCFSLKDNSLHEKFVNHLSIIQRGYTFGTDNTLIDICLNPDLSQEWSFFVRISVGLENIDDLIDDLKEAFKSIGFNC